MPSRFQFSRLAKIIKKEGEESSENAKMSV